ncbi:MAG: OmpA family protein [Myxococcota bacterium]
MLRSKRRFVQAVTLIFYTGSLAALSAGCAATPRTPELLETDNLMANAAAIEKARAADPTLVEQSEANYKKALEAYEDDEQSTSAHHATLARLYMQTAMEYAMTNEATTRLHAAEERKIEAAQTLGEQEERRARFDKRVARMEKIIALETQLDSSEARSAKDKRKLAAEIEQAKKEQAKLKAEQEKAMALERTAQEVNNQLASIAANIQTAESLNADKYDAENLKIAHDNLMQAKRASADKQFEQAKKLAMTAEKAVMTATETARAEFAKRNKELNILAEHKALLEDAGKIGASDVKQKERGVVVTLHNMFAPGKAQVLDNQAHLLDNIAELAAKYDAYPVVIEGYTDSRGRETDNLTLSTSRAQSVSNYLVERKKIEFNRVRAAGYGEANPIADNSTTKGREINRRIEVVFLFR